MKRKQLLFCIGAAIGMFLLIFDSKNAVSSAYEGMILCFQTIIPSLFPFFVLSILLTGSMDGYSMPLLRPLGRLCGIPEGAESILLTGFLGGYPVGAQNISTAHRRGQLAQPDAQRMLAFCNNAGPAFLFGMVGTMFPDSKTPWLLWGIHVVSALITATLLPEKARTHFKSSPVCHAPTLPDTLQTAIRVTSSVCGWVILFRVIVGFFQRWFLWLLPSELQVVLIGLLELSNGCCELKKIEDLSIRFLICSGMLACGGLCVTMQTATVTHGLSLSSYFLGKALQTLFSLLISICIVYHNWLPFASAALFSLIICHGYRKKGRILSHSGI